MAVHLKPLAAQIIVITGASSGIGLATARMAARAGAKLVLSSRNAEALEKIVGEIQAEGGSAISVVADVADEAAVRQIADAAIAGFGGFDTWVNNAGVSIYGRISEVPVAEQRRVFETNYWGVVHGSREAAEHLKTRGGGAIINVGSVLSDRSIPLQGAYSASKHAVKGFTDSLRMELEEEGAPISVTLIKPAAINTPYTKHARSYLPTHPTNPPPVYDPQVVAKAILRCAVTPRRDVFAGGFGKMFSLMETFMPRATDRYMEKTMFAQQHGEGPNEPTDHLDAPTTAEGEERGDYAGMVMKHSAYTAASLHPMAALAMGVGAVGIIASVLAGRRGSARRRQASTWSAIEDQEHANASVGVAARDLQASARADRLGINAEVEASPYEYVP